MAKVKAKKSAVMKAEEVNEKVKEKKVRSEESEAIHRFIVLFVVVLLIVIAIYFVSKLIVDSRSNLGADESVPGEISYDIVSVGMILNRPYDKYYVMVYDGTTPEATHYSAIITSYQALEDSEKIYYCDLSNSLNASYAKKESNPNATTISEFAFTDLTLLEITNGKITKYVETLEEIKEILQ